jgi:hypothetical protein
MDLFETEWDIAYRTGKEDERERILKIIEDYRNKPTFGYSNLISLIKGEQK